MTLSRDVVVAIFLLAVCGVLWYASFDIRVPDYGQLSPATWPRIILGVLTGLSLVYLLQSVRAAGSSAVSTDGIQGDSLENSALDSSGSDSSAARLSSGRFNIVEFYAYWKNVIWCFVLFGLYLYSLPWLGMLLGALAFVFLLLCALGGWQPRKLIFHAVIAVLTVGGMWTLFTYGLGVLLPKGELLGFI